MCEAPDVAGPGFINLRLKEAWLASQLQGIPAAGGADRLGIVRAARPQTVVVDYSGPNIAKEMHIGHIRSTIIGDTFARVLAFDGHQIIRQNHIGDWGTQFGMLCALLKEKMPEAMTRPDQVHLADLETFYREAIARDREDPAFHERARKEVVALHNHDPQTLKAWEYIVEESRRHYLPLYERLGVGLTRDDERGESFYAERLAPLVRELETNFGPDASPKHRDDRLRIRVEESDGALCIFHTDASGEPRFRNQEGEPLPMIIRKSDGAFLYATTDLAALRFRIRELDADRIIYVTDARQLQHFEMVFATGRGAGWMRREGKPEVQLEHATFGSILGEDRKPFKTRSGETVKLADLLDEAVARAEKLVRATEADPDRRRGFNEEEIKDVAVAVGVGAVKYADLSQNRQSDYIFSWDKMLALDGNTAPYLMYAYARIRSIYRKAAEQTETTTVEAGGMQIEDPQERRLTLQILRLPETLDIVADRLKINALTDYLYDLAKSFMSFYEACPVLKADTATQRHTRLQLCDLTARTLKLGLGLLGIRTLERM
jgi:arginyl-tRNA synthetase